MPQRPALRHVLGKIRLACGLSQKELAKLLGVAPITIQKIDQGVLQLSPDLAGKAENELDVAAGWLLANDSNTPPVTPRGGKWTKELYEFVQGGRYIVSESSEPITKRSATQVRSSVTTLIRVNKDFPPVEGAEQFTAWRAADYSARIHAMLAGAKASPRQGILLHRLKRTIESLAEDFPADQRTLDQYGPKIAKLKAAFEKRSKQIAQQETERLWADPVSQPKSS